MTKEVLDDLHAYAVRVRRVLHEHPEVGFDLENTCAYVKGELDGMGIPYTEKYGKCSIVCELGKGERTVALRADMDALPICEKTDLPFASKNEGKMHACGHDAHTAVLLAVARYLKENEDLLPCRVRLIFQPSEECSESGAKMMVENGVMDDVDSILAAHCDNTLTVGEIGAVCGDYMAACAPISLHFYGRTSHATAPEAGVDAIAMAHLAYTRLRDEVRELAGDHPYIWSVGRFVGGHTHNVIADQCDMDISFRFYDGTFAEAVERSTRRIVSEIAEQFGGSADVEFHVSTGAVHNDTETVTSFTHALSHAGLSVKEISRQMTSEDFGWYLTKARGMLFRFGTRNEARGCTDALHTNTFTIDEEGMKNAILAFTSYVFYECE